MRSFSVTAFEMIEGLRCQVGSIFRPRYKVGTVVGTTAGSPSSIPTIILVVLIVVILMIGIAFSADIIEGLVGSIPVVLFMFGAKEK